MKERFANEHEEVSTVLIYKSSLHYLACICITQIKVFLKKIVPFHTKINKKVQAFHGLQLKSRIRNLLKWTAENREYRIYKFNDVAHLDARFKRNCIADLFLFDAAKNWTSYEVFLSSSLQRLEAGDLVYTISCDGVLAFYMWVKTKEVNNYTAETVSPLFVIPQKGIYLYDAYCHPDYRGKGFYQKALSHIQADNPSRIVYGYILATNHIPTHVAQRLGVHEYTVHWKKRLGRIKTCKS